MYDAYDKYLIAAMHPEAHEIAVLELAPDIVIRRDLDLLELTFNSIHNHSKIEDWNVRGQVSTKTLDKDVTFIDRASGILGLCPHYEPRPGTS